MGEEVIVSKTDEIKRDLERLAKADRHGETIQERLSGNHVGWDIMLMLWKFLIV